MMLNGWGRIDHVGYLDQAASWRYLAKAWPKRSRWVEFKERYIRRAREALENARTLRLNNVA